MKPYASRPITPIKTSVKTSVKAPVKTSVKTPVKVQKLFVSTNKAQKLDYSY